MGSIVGLWGSDDKVEDGCLKYIVDRLRENPDIAGVSLNRTAYDYYFKNVLKERPVANGKLQDDTLLTST